MHRPSSQHDPERSWENDFESEPEEQQSAAADLELVGSDFQPEPTASDTRQRPPEPAFVVREHDTLPRSPAALEPDSFPRDGAPVEPIPILLDAALLDPGAPPSEALALEVDPVVPDPLALDSNDSRLEPRRFDEPDLQIQATPALEHRARALPIPPPPAGNAPWIGSGAQALLLAGVMLLLAVGAMWMLGSDVRPPASAPSPPPGASADAGLQAPPPVAVEPPV